MAGMFFKPGKNHSKLKVNINRGQVSQIIVGLGNPGRQYEGTRHNVGFLALDYVAKQYEVPIQKMQFQSLCGVGQVAGLKTLFLKPQTFMNLSGQAVQEAMAYYKVPPEKTLILLDDVHLDVGTIRLRRKGSDGGQNGMKNILYLTGSDLFPRIKIGVGQKPRPDYDLAKWVLGHFTEAELVGVKERLPDISDSCGLILSGNMDKAMSDYSH